MNEYTEYVIDHAKIWIWSGFYNLDRIRELIEDIIEKDADRNEINTFIESEMRNKIADEKTWPQKTDCDKLNQVFIELNDIRIISLQNAGYTMSDGHDDIGEIHSKKPRGYFTGYCFYHGQDLERVVSGKELTLAYGDMKDTDDGKRDVANKIIAISEKNGLTCKWDGNVKKRIDIIGLKWQRRLITQ